MEMKVTQVLLDNLTVQAKASPRLRMSYDLRNSADDQSQRMLKAIEPGYKSSIHRHQKTSETIVCIRGKLVVEYYDELERICSESTIITPNGQVVAVNVPLGQWHSLHALESGTIFMVCKDGAYEPTGPEDVLVL